MIQTDTSIIEALNWRYATKKFDPNRKISDSEIDILLDSLRLSPSSMGLQPYTFFRVKNSDMRQKLRDYSFNQSQITDASEMIVFASKTKITREEIERFAQLNTDVRKKDSDSEKRQAQRLSTYIENFESEALFNWTSRQAYIAMGMLLTTAAQLKIDSCPMEGIQGREYDRILDLEPLNLRTISVVTLGYRSEEDSYQWEPKVRKPLNDLISMI